MSQSQLYRCDICGKELECPYGENVPDEKIKTWFTTNLVASPISHKYHERRTYNDGHICSEDCFDVWVKKVVAISKSKM